VSAQVTPYRSEMSRGRDGFVQLLWAEWSKFSTVRAWVIAALAAAAVTVLMSFVGASGDHTRYCTQRNSMTYCTGRPPVPTGPDGEPVADTFTFVNQMLVGDGSLAVRVASLTGAHVTGKGVGLPGSAIAGTQPGLTPWAKAGILLEPTREHGRCVKPAGQLLQCPGNGSPYVAVMVTGEHGVRMQYNYTHDRPGIPGMATVASARWLRLTRTGDVVTAYDSADGAHWNEIGRAGLVGLAPRAQVGMFVTSPLYFPQGSNTGDPSVATATFDAIRTQGDFPDHGWRDQVMGADAFYLTMYSTLTASSTSSAHQGPAGTFTISGSGDLGPLVGGGIFGNGSGGAILIGGLCGLLVLIVLGTLFATSEYRRGLIRTSFTASPRRGRLLAAKAIVVGSVGFVVGLVGTAVAAVVVRHVLIANGDYLFPVSGAAQARVIFGTALVLAVGPVLALALGMALRRSAGTVAIGTVLLVLPSFLGYKLSPGPANWVMRLTPVAAFAVQGTQPRSPLVSNAYTVVNGYYPLGPWSGFAVLCGYTAVALAAAAWLLRRRDV
jgi:ABC-type transport system involved in multi-copper enzyme maturation permease subunit